MKNKLPYKNAVIREFIITTGQQTLIIHNSLINESQTVTFSGFPRTVIQAEKLSEKQELDIVVNLNVPFETIIDRISVRLIHPSILFDLGFSKISVWSSWKS